MPNTVNPDERSATAPAEQADRPVTLINKFVVPVGRDDAFLALWTEASEYFRAQPGFVSLRLHRAVSPDADYRYVNVARWATFNDFRAAHGTDECRRVIGQDGWKEFPSNPALYDVIVGVDADERQPVA
jgi:heme-degrading monooxygenase HmoA